MSQLRQWKDIIYLEEAGIAEKSHGGAIAKVNAVEKTLSEKGLHLIKMKKRKLR